MGSDSRMVTVEDAKEVSRALVKRIDPVAVIAFGTVATQGRGHDLDILIVTQDRLDGLPLITLLLPFRGSQTPSERAALSSGWSNARGDCCT
jgi:hypothetical protein